MPTITVWCTPCLDGRHENCEQNFAVRCGCRRAGHDHTLEWARQRRAWRAAIAAHPSSRLPR